MKKTICILFTVIVSLCLIVGCNNTPVKTLTKIQIKTEPTKTTYTVGEKLDLAGLVVEGVFSDGTTSTITSYTTEPADGSVLKIIGTTKVEVSSEGKTTSFYVTVSSKVVSSISIKTEPTKKAYFVGDTVDTSGMVLTATYADGSTEDVTSGFTVSPTILTEEGKQTITVSYKGKTATYEVTVSKVATTYTVTFDSKGGSAVESQSVTAGDTAKEPTAPVKANFNFDGWYKDSEYTGTKYDFNTPVTADLTLYAKWVAAVKKQKWCVMSYIDFSDLSTAGVENLDEICQTTPNDNVKAYFLTGGADTNYDISNLPYLSKAIQPFDASNPFKVSSEANSYQLWEYTSEGKFKELPCTIKGMNDSNILIKFMEYCIETAKASDAEAEYKFILELWNHGGGSYVGLIIDAALSATKYQDALMSLADCGKAINYVAEKKNINFEVVIFDMCLMQSVETAHTVSAKHTKYIIGSETSSAGDGSAYTDWFNFLYQNPTATGAEFGKCFCDTAYQKLIKLKKEDFIKNMTWSVVDMSKFAAVETAYDAYAASELSKLSATTVEDVLKRIDQQEAFDPQSQFWVNYMYDINAFTSNIGGTPARATLMDAIKNAIVYMKNGSLQEEAKVCGLSMCILANSSDWKTKWEFTSEWNNQYLANCLTENYRIFQKRIATGL